VWVGGVVGGGGGGVGNAVLYVRGRTLNSGQ
jgi:hypothetical protein